MKSRALLAVVLLTILTACSGGPRKERSQELRIVTYNIRYDTANDGANAWPNRKAALAVQLNWMRPDILGMQEALAHQVAYIDSAMHTMQAFGVGRDDGMAAGEFSPLLIDTTRFAVASSGTFWLSETPEIPSRGWDAALNRICTWALVQDRKTASKLVVYNVHFDHIGEIAREKSVELIINRTDSLRKAGIPVIFMGDLNLTPDKTAVKKALDVFVDSRAAAENVQEPVPGTFNGFNPEKTAADRIDYVLFSPASMKVRKYEVPVVTVNGLFMSDHFPVLAIFRQVF